MSIRQVSDAENAKEERDVRLAHNTGSLQHFRRMREIGHFVDLRTVEEIQSSVPDWPSDLDFAIYADRLQRGIIRAPRGRRKRLEFETVQIHLAMFDYGTLVRWLERLEKRGTLTAWKLRFTPDRMSGTTLSELAATFVTRRRGINMAPRSLQNRYNAFKEKWKLEFWPLQHRNGELVGS